jgi:hypothetical protein
MGNAVAIDVQLTSVWQGGDDPVPYPDWDTSAHLDGWHKLYVYQWAIGIFRAYEEAEQRAKDRVRLEEAIANPPDKWFWYGVSAFSLLLAAGWMFADKLMSAGKRLLVWSKP